MQRDLKTLVNNMCSFSEHDKTENILHNTLVIIVSYMNIFHIVGKP